MDGRAGMAWVISREVSNRARLFSRPAAAEAAANDDDFNAGDNEEDDAAADTGALVLLLPLEAVLLSR